MKKLPKGKYTLKIDNLWKNGDRDVKDYTVRIYSQSKITITPAGITVYKDDKIFALERKFTEISKHESSIKKTPDNGFNIKKGSLGDGYYYLGVDSIKNEKAEFTL